MEHYFFCIKPENAIITRTIKAYKFFPSSCLMITLLQAGSNDGDSADKPNRDASPSPLGIELQTRGEQALVVQEDGEMISGQSDGPPPPHPGWNKFVDLMATRKKNSALLAVPAIDQQNSAAVKDNAFGRAVNCSSKISATDDFTIGNAQNADGNAGAKLADDTVNGSVIEQEHDKENCDVVDVSSNLAQPVNHLTSPSVHRNIDDNANNDKHLVQLNRAPSAEEEILQNVSSVHLN